MLDPRIKKLIEGVRATHTPLLWQRFAGNAHLSDPFEPNCEGCASGLVLHSECPFLAAAKELEDEESS